MSTRALLSQTKPKVHPLEISIGTVHVRSMTGAGRVAYSKLVRKHEPETPPAHEIVALGLCYEDGNLEFDVDDEKDLADLSGMEGEDLQNICIKLFEVSGLAPKAAEKEEKNS